MYCIKLNFVVFKGGCRGLIHITVMSFECSSLNYLYIFIEDHSANTLNMNHYCSSYLWTPTNDTTKIENGIMPPPPGTLLSVL